MSIEIDNNLTLPRECHENKDLHSHQGKLCRLGLRVHEQNNILIFVKRAVARLGLEKKVAGRLQGLQQRGLNNGHGHDALGVKVVGQRDHLESGAEQSGALIEVGGAVGVVRVRVEVEGAAERHHLGEGVEGGAELAEVGGQVLDRVDVEADEVVARRRRRRREFVFVGEGGVVDEACRYVEGVGDGRARH